MKGARKLATVYLPPTVLAAYGDLMKAILWRVDPKLPQEV
jgi:hypothetical protein